MPSAEYLNQPFEAAIQFFLAKLGIGTESWAEMWQEAHDEAFAVAGAMEKDLLDDLRKAVGKAISQGTTLETFRADFRDIVNRHGWTYKGDEAWRSAVIFNTNLSTAYHAGHYEHMLDPDVLKARPYWRYVRSSSRNPRKDHMQWYDLVLPADDPFWLTHAPPNGWGCKCGIVNASEREVARWRKEIPNLSTKRPKIKTYDWKNPATGKVEKVPEGIDPGWAYRPGGKRA